MQQLAPFANWQYNSVQYSTTRCQRISLYVPTKRNRLPAGPQKLPVRQLCTSTAPDKTGSSHYWVKSRAPSSGVLGHNISKFDLGRPEGVIFPPCVSNSRDLWRRLKLSVGSEDELVHLQQQLLRQSAGWQKHNTVLLCTSGRVRVCSDVICWLSTSCLFGFLVKKAAKPEWRCIKTGRWRHLQHSLPGKKNKN